MLSASSTVNNHLQQYTIDSTHNIFLDYWVQGGIIGVMLFGTVLFTAFYKFIKNNKKFEITILFGLLTVFSFNPLSVASLIALWWVLGQAFIVDSNHRK